MRKPILNEIENQIITDNILNKCFVELKEDYSNLGEAMNIFLPDFLKYFQHVDSCIRVNKYRLQGWLSLEYFNGKMKSMPAGTFEHNQEYPYYLIVWEMEIDLKK